MRNLVLMLCCLLFPSALKAQPTPASLKTASSALELFERDWVLMNWALKHFDANHNLLLEPNEAALAAQAFRSFADSNHDGRVSPQEFEDARAKILAGLE